MFEQGICAGLHGPPLHMLCSPGHLCLGHEPMRMCAAPSHSQQLCMRACRILQLRQRMASQLAIRATRQPQQQQQQQAPKLLNVQAPATMVRPRAP